MQSKIRLIIADDHLMFIEGLRLLLQAEKDMQIIDIANDGRELLDLLHHQLPDVILLDINMPKLNGLETARHIKQSYHNVKVIMLSTYNEEHLIEKAKQYQANGYLLKNSSKEELISTIRLVASGHSCFPFRPAAMENEFAAKDFFLKQFNLTKREGEVLQLIKKSFTNQQMADALFLSIYTVETHRKNIMHKLGLNNPVALMKFIGEHNL